MDHFHGYVSHNQRVAFPEKISKNSSVGFGFSILNPDEKNSSSWLVWLITVNIMTRIPHIPSNIVTDMTNDYLIITYYLKRVVQQSLRFVYCYYSCHYYYYQLLYHLINHQFLLFDLINYIVILLLLSHLSYL